MKNRIMKKEISLLLSVVMIAMALSLTMLHAKAEAPDLESDAASIIYAKMFAK